MRKVLLLATGLALSMAVSSLAGTVPIKKGWNLIGSSCGFSVEDVQNDPNVDKVTTIWQWDADERKWLVWSPDERIMELLNDFGLETFDEVKPYRGFWVNAKEAFNVDLCDYDCKVETAPTVNLSEGLVAYYSFDDSTFRDESGHGNHGKVTSGAVSYVDGVYGKAVSIEDDTVELPVELVNGTFTMNLWYKAVSGDYVYILTGDSDNATREFAIYFDDSTGYSLVYVYYHNSYDQYFKAPDMSDKFHMLTFVRDAEVRALKVYVDGKAIATVADKDDLNITKLYFGSGSYYNALFDEVGFWNRTLSEEEIQTLYDKYSNHPPEVATTEIILSAGQSISISINDADNDTFTVEVESSDENVATASYNEESKLLTITANAEGNATVTVTVTDTENAKTTVEYNVTVR